MEYNKEVEKIGKKIGRLIQTRGPRDSQYKVENELTMELRQQIKELKSELEKTDDVKKLPGDQIDHEIRKAVHESLEKAKIENENIVSVLKAELNILKEKITLKEEIIDVLKMKMTKTNPDLLEVVLEDERPQMKNVFVDPLDVDDKYLESHIDIETVTADGVENTKDKINKLKVLLGGLKK